MTLPPEILDKILKRISANKEQQTLMACALVATWWTGPSQRRLFSSVEVRQRNFELWMNGVVFSGSKAHLLKHVRSLSHSRGPSIRGVKYRMSELLRDSGEYLSALLNLHSLTLHNIRVERIGKEGLHTCFSAFRESLTSLSLVSPTMSVSAFVALVDFFPNMVTLQLHAFVPEADEGPVPSLSRPLRGKVYLRHIAGRSCLELLNRFSKLDLEYEELVIDFALSSFTRAAFLESALRVSSSTVKFLRLTADIDYEPDRE